MPGFLTAWVVYGLTTYTKPSQFERIVQALIYSFIINVILIIIKPLILFLGNCYSFGTWDHNSELLTSALMAIILGLSLAYFMRNDAFFDIARKMKLTSRTPFPSEWYGAFAEKPRYLVLHIEGGRRISGYPLEWPSDPSVGHFKLTDAVWLTDDNKEISLNCDSSILIPTKQVEIVELLKTVEETANATKATKSTT